MYINILILYIKIMTQIIHIGKRDIDAKEMTYLLRKKSPHSSLFKHIMKSWNDSKSFI